MALQNPETSASSASLFSSPPPYLEKTNASKVRYVYEINHIRNDQNIQHQYASLPSINPYKDLTNPFTTMFKSVKSSLNPCRRRRRQIPREKIQVIRFEECPISSGEEEHFINIKLSPQSIRQWLSEGYSYVHFGAIRLGLTFHGREGFSVATRIALLDSGCTNYQFACFGVVETTLNAGTFFVTLFPHWTLPLEHEGSATRFQVHMQMVGAPMVPGLVQATLQSEMACRVHRSVFDNPSPLPMPRPYKGMPLIQVDSKYVTTTTYIPRTITREEFVSILPETWVTNFENRSRKTEEAPSHNKKPSLSLIGNAGGPLTVKFNG
ncbi:hypothetical protein PTKIN_Ptkin05aG0019700 [Pterospermum kingtungense]